MIAGAPRPAAPDRARVLHRNPCRSTEVLAEVPLGDAPEIAAAAEAGAAAQAAWARTDPSARADLLERWADDLAAQRDRLTDLVVREVGKPRRAAAEEVGRAAAHARVAAELVRASADPSRIAAGVVARQRPIGVVGLITPWNNPLAIPVGKIAPALGFGNAVVLKPAPEASATALALLEGLQRVGLPAGLANVVLGDGTTARALCREPRIAAVAVTGSIATGRVVAGAVRARHEAAAGGAGRQQRGDRARRRRSRAHGARPGAGGVRLRRPALHGDPPHRRRGRRRAPASTALMADAVAGAGDRRARTTRRRRSGPLISSREARRA